MHIVYYSDKRARKDAHNRVNEIYRFLDKLQSRHKTQVEQIAYAHSKRVLGGQPSVGQPTGQCRSVGFDVYPLWKIRSYEDCEYLKSVAGNQLFLAYSPGDTTGK